MEEERRATVADMLAINQIAERFFGVKLTDAILGPPLDPTQLAELCRVKQSDAQVPVAPLKNLALPIWED
jgi:hypothetical protein